MPHLPPEVIRALALAAVALLVAPPADAAPAKKKPGSTAPLTRTFTPWEQPPPPAPATTDELLAMGRRVYKGACAHCHGETGEGDGREGQKILIPPRDFTTGQFIVRSTPMGSLPLDADLFASIRRGFVPSIGMPAFEFLSDREVWAVIAYIKTFSKRWKDEEVPPPVPVPPPIARTKDAIDAGFQTFSMFCGVCHGATGQGDGLAAAGLTYSNGKNTKPMKPADFTAPWKFKSGGRPQDLFLIISNGMDGTPMPSFSAMLSSEQRWQLVYWIMSRGEEAKKAAAAVAAPPK